MTGAFLFSCKKNDTGVLFYGTRYRCSIFATAMPLFFRRPSVLNR